MQNVTSFTFKGKQHFLLDIFSVQGQTWGKQVHASLFIPSVDAGIHLHKLLELVTVTARELLAELIGEFGETKFSRVRSTEDF